MIFLILLVTGCVSQNGQATPTPLPVLSKSDISAQVLRVAQLPQGVRYPDPDYPQVVGIDARNGKVLEIISFCSDICPNYEAKRLLYQNVTKEDCVKIGGNALGDKSWGGYIGCEPVQ